jgi:hypothetical protein
MAELSLPGDAINLPESQSRVISRPKLSDSWRTRGGNSGHRRYFRNAAARDRILKVAGAPEISSAWP